MKRFFHFLLALIVIASLFGIHINTPPVSHAQSVSSASIEWLEKCQFDQVFLAPDIETVGETLICGNLITRENPNDPQSLEIKIAFTILFAQTPTPEADPIVYLEGGPGGSALFNLDPWVTSPLRAQRDIILLDQRGTGYSQPTLSCYYYDEGYDGTQEAMRRCIASIEASGADIGNYNTINNAHDVMELLTLLQSEQGYTTYNLLGISYGTRLALAVMRDYPQLVRSAILDSVYPQAVDAYGELAINAQSALDALFDACERDAECNSAYPNLEQVFYEVVEELNADPIEGAYDGSAFIDDMFSALYDVNLVKVLPAVIYLYQRGDWEEADEYFYNGLPEESSDYADYYDAYDPDLTDLYFTAFDQLSDSEGMFMALECQEEAYFSSYDEAVRITENSDIDPLVADSQLLSAEITYQDCALWVDTPAPPIANERIYSDVPTLLVSGEFDPITPPRWAAFAAETLPNSYNFVFPSFGHGLTDGHPCIISVFEAFLADPTSEPDASCRAEMRTEWFIHPDFG